MTNAIIYAIIFVALAGFGAAMNSIANNSMEEKCLQAGGDFYKAKADARHSLCKKPLSK